jgi:hypothetical protein
MDRTVIQFHYQLSTCTSPRLIILPHVVISMRCRIMTETTAARCYCFGQMLAGLRKVDSREFCGGGHSLLSGGSS